MRVRGLFVPLVGLLVGGCVSVSGDKAFVPPSGLYADFQAPLTVSSTAFPCDHLKSGKGARAFYLKEWVWSGASGGACNMALEEAIRNGGLKKVYFADYSQYSLFGFVTFFTVTAYGE